MKRNTNSIQIDKNKLQAELRKRGSSMEAAGTKIGYSKKGIQSAAYSGRITRSMLNLLNVFFGINESDIAPDPEPEPAKEPEKEPEAPQAAQTCAGLTETQVYHAVKAAMWDALRERDDEKAQKAKTSNGDAQYVLLYRAMLDAMNQAFKINAKEIRGLIFAAAMNAVRMSLKKDMLNEGQSIARFVE